MILSKFALTDRVAIVTGAGKGIGKSIAIGFAEAGADVVVAARTITDIEATAADIRALGRKALVVATDARNSDQVANMVQRTMNEFGRIDILVNNVGSPLGLVGPLLDTNDDDWDRVFDVCLKSTFICCKAVGKAMITQKRGSIINIASLAGVVPYPPATHYGAAKAGVIYLTKTLALELGPSNIRVNAIAPGPILTEQLEEVFAKRPEEREQRLRKIILRHLGQPDDIAAAAVYLASDAADFVTGETIMVTGGLTTYL
ncbi:SDR family NAD(P)-dependent oxidoreductase [Chloroflexota bacterium]